MVLTWKTSPATRSGSESLIFRLFLFSLFQLYLPHVFRPVSPPDNASIVTLAACVTHYWRAAADGVAQLGRGNSSSSSCSPQFSLFTFLAAAASSNFYRHIRWRLFTSSSPKDPENQLPSISKHWGGWAGEGAGWPVARADEGTVCEMLQIQNPAEAEMGKTGCKWKDDGIMKWEMERVKEKKIRVHLEMKEYVKSGIVINLESPGYPPYQFRFLRYN